MAGWTIAAWYRETDPADVLGIARRALEPPFAWVGHPDECGAPATGWEALRSRGRRAYFGLSERSEGHLVLEVMVRGASRDHEEDFGAVFHRLLAETPASAECILAATSADVYPWFTHSFHRAAPLAAIVVEDASGDVEVHGLDHDGYWAEVGPRLHFVHAATLARVGGPAPMDHARSVGASVQPLGAGWLFDCGWSRRGRAA